MGRPTKDEILAAVAELEPFTSTLSRFPGLTRGELIAILRGRARARSDLDDEPSGAIRPAARAVSEGPKTGPSDRPSSRAIPREMKLIVSSDGASRGNPGPASIGVVLATPDGRIIETISRRVGRTTNNLAEYHAVRAGLERARELGAYSVHLRADSELAIRQLTGVYQVKNEVLRPLFDEVKRLEAGFAGGVTYEHVRREYNRQADALANEALDGS